MLKKKIAILDGDGIGPEVIKQTLKVLKIIEKKFGHNFEYEYCLIGAIAIKKTGLSLPNDTLNICLSADAVLLGSVGNPNYDNNFCIEKPEYGLLKLRKEMDVYCNIRPIKTYSNIIDKSPIKNSIINNVDFIIYRELVGGIYFGKKGYKYNKAYDYCEYSEYQIERIARKAFEASLKRKKNICLVDKSNVLETSRLWRKVVKNLNKEYINVKLDYMYIDNAAMQIIINPKQFDIILTENMFGDIISDESSVISGSIGLLPSASIGEKGAIFEPVHGSYPEATGKNIANPIGAILSGAMMLDFFGLYKERDLIYNAVNFIINNNYYTIDIDNFIYKNTEEIGDLIVNYLINN